jgi:hypothetical protein
MGLYSGKEQNDNGSHIATSRGVLAKHLCLPYTDCVYGGTPTSAGTTVEQVSHTGTGEVTAVKYTLLQDGDNLEMDSWPVLRGAWPNYEVVWQEFIAPLTMRVYGIRDVGLRPGTDALLEEMCMAHYSVFYHLARSHELLARLERETKLPHHYDEIFFHMSAATEMVDRLLLALWKIQQRVEAQTPPEPFSIVEVCELAYAFHQDHYGKIYREHLRTGRAVSVALHNVRDLVKPILLRIDALKLSSQLWTSGDRIRHYRNVLAHNPLIPKLVSGDNVAHLPRPDKLNQYDLWSTAFFGKDVEADYVAGPELVQGFLEEFEAHLNALWGKLIGLINEWSKTQEYRAMEPANSHAPGPDAPRPPTQPSTLSSSLSSSSGSGLSTMRTERRTILPSGTASVSDLLDMQDQDGQS